MAQQQGITGHISPAISTSREGSRPLGDFTLSTTPDLTAYDLNMSTFVEEATDKFDESTDFLNEPLFPELQNLPTVPGASNALQSNLLCQPQVSNALQPNLVGQHQATSAPEQNMISQPEAGKVFQPNQSN